MRVKADNVDGYILGFPPGTRAMLEELRRTIRKTAPAAEECISYAMPAYKLNGMLVYFAGYTGHVGFYPGAGGIAAFKDELSEHKWAKGSVQFPLDEPLPLKLITRIVKFRVKQNLNKKIKSKT
jgi:uncharacterized protein YdhG (YjbR/CyaY superfamily)